MLKDRIAGSYTIGMFLEKTTTDNGIKYETFLFDM